MGRALRLATLGVPVGGGGGVSLPESITDDFSADSGLWLDGDLAAAAITVSGGKGIWAPTEGAELHVAANAASDPNGNEANATTGWAGVGVTLSVEAVDVDTGSYAIKGVAADGSSDRAYYAWTDVTRGWVLQRCAAKTTVGTAWLIRSNIDSFMRGDIPVASSWQDYILAFYKYTNTTATSGPYTTTGAVADDAMLIDNVSAKLLAPASTVRVQRIYYPSELSVKLWGLNYLPKGLIFYKDENNWIAALTVASKGLGFVALLKCVGGVAAAVTLLQGITYSAGAALQLIPAADFQTWTVKYGAATPINAQAITDFAASGTWYAGLLNTYDAGDMSIAFDDFSATRIAEAPPF